MVAMMDVLPFQGLWVCSDDRKYNKKSLAPYDPKLNDSPLWYLAQLQSTKMVIELHQCYSVGPRRTCQPQESEKPKESWVGRKLCCVERVSA